MNMETTVNINIKKITNINIPMKNNINTLKIVNINTKINQKKNMHTQMITHMITNMTTSLITSMTITTMIITETNTNTNKIMDNIKAWVWKLQFFTRYVILYLISADVIQSIGLLISSLFIFFLGSNKGAHVTEWNDWHYLDPISTYIFSVIVIISTFPIVKNCYFIIMESTPSTEVAR